jgi:hypothetical protein
MKRSEPKWERGFKVVGTMRGRYVSATTLGRRVFYSTHTVTTRPSRCGPLAVFENHQDALDFLYGLVTNRTLYYGTPVVKSCRYVRARRPTGKWILWTPKSGTPYVPKFTVLASAVQLTREGRRCKR